MHTTRRTVPRAAVAALAALVGATGSAQATDSDPLLSNPGKHYFVSQLCDGAPDDTPIDWSQDPRLLLQKAGFAGSLSLIDSEQYAVHFNDPFEVCHTPTLFQNQAAQNAILVASGQRPIHSARPYAATCGEWRARVQEGHDWIALFPTDQSRHDGHGGTPVGPFSSYASAVYGGADTQAWNNLWRVWNMSERPANFDEQVSERYGHSPTPDHLYNPYPMPGEEQLVSKTFGGTGRLPLGFAQGRDASGTYNARSGLNCFSCHGGQIGAGEVASRDGNGDDPGSYGANAYGSFMGLPNTNTELGVLIADLINAEQYAYGNSPAKMPAFGYVPLVNTTRGTNAADTEIEAIVALRDFDTLGFSHVFAYPVHANFGDQDPPAWWWLHNKTRYLWFGGHSTDSSRGNMYFGSVNGLSGDQVEENEGIFESVHDWTLTVEAPSYPLGYCTGPGGSRGPDDPEGCIDRALAEQGAVIFHSKDLWADAGNADIPRPKGNGSCAGCHGAYAPRYASDPTFLPDPKLSGVTGYTVPLEIVGTDPAQAEGWAAEIDGHVSTFWWSYPDAQPNYRFPENKDPFTEELDDYIGVFGQVTPSNIADHLRRQIDGFSETLDAAIVAAIALFDQGLGEYGDTSVPVNEQLGRVKGACSFEEKTVGYVTPPLHGVWASAPYFHNGSVPTVWQVLEPADRVPVWRRQRSAAPVHFPGFEHEISGANSAYDYTRLGWKHDVLTCGADAEIPYYQCQGPIEAPQEILWTKDTLIGGTSWPTWLVPPPVGEEGLEDRMIYNSNLYSKNNRGHEFTKVLTDTQRRALIEYLKTL